MPNLRPHPPYSDTYVLPKTKYGIPVTAEMFENNTFASHGTDPEDHLGRWWELVWAAEAAKQRKIIEESETRGRVYKVEDSQRYRPTTEEEFRAYMMWTSEAETVEREQKRDAARRAKREKEIAKEVVDKMRMEEDMLGQQGDEGVNGERGGGGQDGKLKKWFKKLLP